MKYFRYILTGLFGIMLAGCSDTDSPLPTAGAGGAGAEIVGDKVILTSALDVEGFRDVNASRAFPEQPSLKDLNLYLVEFIDNGDPLTNTLSAVYRPSAETADAANSTVTYTVTLNKTDQPRILHLLAVADDNLDIPYGVESSVMPGLTSQDEQDAYWRRLEFPAGYCTRVSGTGTTEKWEVNQDITDKLIGRNVKLVRNFAKITVGVDPSVQNFNLEGFIIINEPLKGTMAPYSATTKEFPKFINDDGTSLTYAQVAAGYSGISPAGTTLDNQVVTEQGPAVKDSELTQYMYERPFRSINRTYIVVKGSYQRGPSTYYKLDLGNNDNNGIFRYYGILRNFNYNITITGVATAGAENVAAAAAGTVYNNISFDIDTDELKNMSDGTDLIRVNNTTVVVTDDKYSFDFQYAYKTGINGLNNGTYNNNLASLIDFKPGSVIKSITNVRTEIGADNTPWYTATVTCNNPTNVTETQSFVVVNKDTGLGRTINLVSHTKWEFENLREFARIWENYPSTYRGLNTYNPDNTSERNPHIAASGAAGTLDVTYQGYCGTEAGSQFTIFFDIPDNIPEVLFPLEFTIESNWQGLENEPMGTIVVTSGPSLFSENDGYNRIQYIKSVTWTEYNSELRMDARDDNGTMIGNPEDGPVIHRVRCRFRTIEAVTPGTPQASVTVAIANQNFNQGTVHFTRTNAANNLRGPGLVGTPN